MIVDAATLDVKPIADRLLEAAAGRIIGDVDFPEGITWSNELALHVIELKVTEPVPSFEGVAERFQASVRRANDLLRPMGACLMPTGMHPWMDPFREMRLWPHECSAVYEAFDRIFDCRGHGWANLQSCHLNLPFADDEEFARLHAAIRFLLTIFPALTASSPIVEGRNTGFLDTRLEYYRNNSARVPSVAGLVVPEPVSSQAEYQEKILSRIYADLGPHDPEGVLQDEYANARGAIARFSRGAIEIRVLDVQECPAADLAACDFIRAVLQLLIRDRATISSMQAYPTEKLHSLLLETIRYGNAAELPDRKYTAILGVESSATRTVRSLLGYLCERARPALRTRIDEHGSLARRILDAAGHDVSRERLTPLYARLCECLNAGESFVPRPGSH
jgi:gamma-glutamyl:cysteine ligase YbdK (ATP-grasp superfamily)